MTAKFDKFKAELIALCEEHSIHLNISKYDPDVLQVIDNYHGILYDLNRLEDLTSKEPPEQPAPPPPSQP